MVEFETKIKEIIRRTPDAKSFRMEAKENLSFKPGQFFLMAINIGGKESTKYFSFSNSPTETGYIEFTKRITSSEFSKTLDSMKIGDKARVKMPLGSFTFEGEYEKIAFLSGGIGITPIRSMCKFVVDKGLPTDIVLLYGNTSEKNIAFRDDFDIMQATKENMRVIYTLTSPNAGTGAGKCRSGYINDKMITEEIPDYKERVFYVCGPPKMVEGLVCVLKDKLNVEKEKIRLENFVGY